MGPAMSIPNAKMSNPSGRYLVRATQGASPLWLRSGATGLEPVPTSESGLSDRLIVAFDDWASFFDDIAGDLSDDEVAHEFVSQGFKIAHRLRAEIKGSEVHLLHPQTGEEVPIERTGPK